MRVVNLVDSVDGINFGIWNAALNTSRLLSREFGVETEIWTPSTNSSWDHSAYELSAVRMLDSVGRQGCDAVIRTASISPHDTVIVSHGVWQFASRWGYHLAKRDFAWMSVPHGMLEPWPLQQKKFRKLVYRHLFEDRYLAKASVVRAVASPEKANLHKLLGPRHYVELIPNGVDPPQFDVSDKPVQRTILFMGRLHKKKCVTELVQAFVSLTAAERAGSRLLIVGPDHGELEKIQQILNSSQEANIEVLGPIYGDEKAALLREATFFALPSHSEGLPTAVLEAMSFGCIPIITEGCNIPEATSANLGIVVKPSQDSIAAGVRTGLAVDEGALRAKQLATSKFVRENYSIEVIARNLHSLFGQMLANQY